MPRKANKTNNLAVKNRTLARQWHPTKNGDLKPTDVTVFSNKKVWWKHCKKGHPEWEATVANRSNGNGCPYCTGNKVDISTCLQTINPDLASEWHPTKNKLKPTEVTRGSGLKAWWQCKHGHEWQVSIDTRRSNGCPFCVGQKVDISNCLQTKKPELARDWHPTKNGELKPTEVTTGSGKKAWWKCDYGHEWEAVIAKRTAGRGCPYCRGLSVDISNCLQTKKPELANEWHPTKNGDLKPTHFAVFSNKKVWWRCDFGHEWESTISNRSRGQGCLKCSIRDSILLTTSEFVNLAKFRHNGKYDYSNTHVYILEEKIEIICHIHGSFMQSAISHLRGHGCQKCGYKQLNKKQESLEDKKRFDSMMIGTSFNNLRKIL